jgi:hypothetical protein
MEQSSASEDSKSSANQMLRFYGTTNFIDVFTRSVSFVPILSQMNAVLHPFCLL